MLKVFNKWSIRMILGAIITNPNLNKRHKKWKKRNTVTWESKSNIKLLFVQPHIPPHLHGSVHGSPTFLQEQHIEHPLSTLHPHFVSSFLASGTLGYVIQHGTKLFPCFFHPHWSRIGRFCIGINDRAQTNAAWYTALRTRCFNESCVRSKFSSCRLCWAKSCRLHLFTLYLVDAAWYIKQTNLSMVFLSQFY